MIGSIGLEKEKTSTIINLDCQHDRFGVTMETEFEYASDTLSNGLH